MFDPDTVTFLASGCGLVVGTVSADGAPRATRAWGLDVVSVDERRVRLLLDRDDGPTLEHLAGGGAVAVTATDVPTLHSTQLKGHATGLEDATDADRARARRYGDDFFRDIHDTEGTPLDLLERLYPTDVVACTIVVAARYDQTPGPQAGTPIQSGRA